VIDCFLSVAKACRRRRRAAVEKKKKKNYFAFRHQPKPMLRLSSSAFLRSHAFAAQRSALLMMSSSMRTAMTEINKVEKGNIIRDGSKYYEVLFTAHKKVQQRTPVVTVDLQDLASGKKIQKKYRGGIDELDVADVEYRDMRVVQEDEDVDEEENEEAASDEDEDSSSASRGRSSQSSSSSSSNGDEELVVEDVRSGETLRIRWSDLSAGSESAGSDDAGSIGNIDRRFIAGGMKLLVRMDVENDKFISVEFPEKVECVVKDAPDTNMNLNDNGKKVKLANGIIVKVPGHIRTGDTILVKTKDKSYVERVSTASD
jgi:Elongation factor P, C-terminal/Elongation factor P (EF-P) KOW-like domain